VGARVAGRDAPHGVRGARARDQHRHKGEHGAGRHGPSFAHRPRRCVSPTAEVRASRLEQRPCLAWLGLIDNIIQTWTKDSPEQRRCVARDDGAIMSTLDFARFTSYNIKTLGGGRQPPIRGSSSLPPPRPPRMDAASLSTSFVVASLLVGRCHFPAVPVDTAALPDRPSPLTTRPACAP